MGRYTADSNARSISDSHLPAIRHWQSARLSPGMVEEK
jgi:hypothetical protein